MAGVDGRRKLPRLSRPQRLPRTRAGRVATVLVFVLAGLLITVSGIAARGTDLRNDRNVSLRDLINTHAQQNTQLQEQIDALRSEVDELSSRDFSLGQIRRDTSEAELVASTAPVTGPGVRVTLRDAPADVKPAGVDDDDLVVHQQDIQSVVNALWAGGAEAMTIQDQRVIATTGIKCVGNTVVLHGVPYAPPYVIEAIGSPEKLEQALENAEAVRIYREYVDAYGLGYLQERLDVVEMPAFSGVLGITNAQATSGD
uniref:DUF881 domain-containing protein n=1 Tax=Tessaracoccus timonensis TaxID=2161816 RepID=UPI00157181FF